MPAATNKRELQAALEKEYSKFRELIETVHPDLAIAHDDDGISIKDIVGHRAHWIGLFIGWHNDGLTGKEVFFPAEGYKWNDLKRYNADLRSKQSDLTWNQVVRDLDTAHQAIDTFIEGRSNTQLYAGPMKGANNSWTAGRWAEAAGPSHYRSAAKYIRARLRDAKGDG